MEKNTKQSANDNSGAKRTEAGKSDLVIHDGEENVELVDSEWADFERALRYLFHQINRRLLFFFFLFVSFSSSTDKIDWILC